jgi:hypothetical protein
MQDSARSEFAKWIYLVTEVVCDFILIAVWGLLALLLNYLFRHLFHLEGWSLYVRYTLEGIIDLSILIKLLILRFGFLRSRSPKQWWE